MAASSITESGLHGASFAVIAAALDIERAISKEDVTEAMVDDFRWTIEGLEAAVASAREDGTAAGDEPDEG